MNSEDLERLVEARHSHPYFVLGLQPDGKNGHLIRTLRPHAETVTAVLADGSSLAMKRVNREGLFEVALDAAPDSYRFQIVDREGVEYEVLDPYNHQVQIDDTDLYLFGEGTHFKTYNLMGAHIREINGTSGVQFTVWAPGAERVSVIGDFNRWDGRIYPMQNQGSSGVWTLFIPGLTEGDHYKFEIRGQGGSLSQKSDPYAFAAEVRPRTASRVWNLENYEWNDAQWMEERRTRDTQNAPVSVYEVHLGSWKRVTGDEERFLTYRELAADLIPYVKDLGFTHLELLPLSEHPFDGSWGYQTLGYYAVTSRFGTPDDFKFFVDECHAAGIGVIIDWVPAHFPKDAHGLAKFDGSCLYEHSDPRQGEHMDWGTLIFNYDRNEVRTFLLANAMFWADIYHIDGIRVDAVASMLYLDYSREEGQWIPNEYGGRENLGAVSFLKTFNEEIHKDFPGILTFAEESTSWPMVSRPTYLGGLGFGLKWNMGWMNDTLEYIEKESIHRKYHHGEITFSLIYAFTENFILPFSHDEVVHGKKSMLDKMPGDLWQKFANLRMLYTYMWTHPGKKLLFMGCEFGQWKEWQADEQLEWHLTTHEPHHSLRALVRDLNKVYTEYPALNELDYDGEGFEWIDLHDSEQSVLSYVRKAKDAKDFVVVVMNATPIVREGYRLGVPEPGTYEEVLNSDAEAYGGSNVGNGGAINTDTVPWMGREHSLQVTVPPLGAVILKKRA